MSRVHECAAMDEFVSIDGTEATLVGDLKFATGGAKMPIVAQPAGGYCLFPGGAGNYVSLGTSSTLRQPLPCSIFAWIWIEPSAAAATMGIWTNHDVTPNNGGAQIYLTSGRKIVGKIGQTTSNLYKTKTGVTSVPKGEWHSVATVLVSTSDMLVYLDGADDGGSYAGSGTSLSWPGTGSSIGRYMAGSIFDGRIDEVMYFKDALSGAEVQALHDRGRDAGSYSDTNLVAYWRFDDETYDDDVGSINGSPQGTVSIVTETDLARFECKDAGAYRSVMAADFLLNTPIDHLVASQKADERKRIMDAYKIGLLREKGKLKAIPRIARQPKASFGLGGLADWTYENLLYMADRDEQIKARVATLEERVKQ